MNDVVPDGAACGPSVEKLMEEIDSLMVNPRSNPRYLAYLLNRLLWTLCKERVARRNERPIAWHLKTHDRAIEAVRQMLESVTHNVNWGNMWGHVWTRWPQ